MKKYATPFLPLSVFELDVSEALKLDISEALWRLDRNWGKLNEKIAADDVRIREIQQQQENRLCVLFAIEAVQRMIVDSVSNGDDNSIWAELERVEKVYGDLESN